MFKTDVTTRSKRPSGTINFNGRNIKKISLEQNMIRHRNISVSKNNHT